MKKIDIEYFSVGMKNEVTRSFSDNDVKIFAEVSGDKNPVHLSSEYAKQTIFKERIVHGALVSSIFSSMFANNLPGPGCIYLKSDFTYLKPVFLNEEVVFTVEITAVDLPKRRIHFNNSAVSPSGLCIVGKSQIYIP